mmetsp:Transcript_623/g.1608  ORF Transcript_623/g.1608 Transcript_623/m.1608 type:complete len:223 (+) Transcript_623:1279-1947(+)|eukprot:scaffold18911_cov32-Tisochrysis_lutea.AAC.1
MQIETPSNGREAASRASRTAPKCVASKSASSSQHPASSERKIHSARTTQTCGDAAAKYARSGRADAPSGTITCVHPDGSDSPETLPVAPRKLALAMSASASLRGIPALSARLLEHALARSALGRLLRLDGAWSAAAFASDASGLDAAFGRPRFEAFWFGDDAAPARRRRRGTTALVLEASSKALRCPTGTSILGADAACALGRRPPFFRVSQLTMPTGSSLG